MSKFLKFFIFTFFLVSQTASIYSISNNHSFEIKTKFGLFPLSIPDLRLPGIKKLKLVTVSESILPDLPDWIDTRYIPENPSWLDKAGNFYKEGIENLFLGELDIALKRFQTVADEYPETQWYDQSWFWLGQVLARQNKFIQAEKSLKFFLDALKSGNKFEYFSEYKDFSFYTLAWLSLKKRKYKEALLLIEKFESEISDKKLQNQLHYLKYFTYQKLNKTSSIIFTLLKKGTQEFPFNFDHIVRLAEHYYMEKRWQNLADLVTSQSSKSSFYNDSQMEYFCWLGLMAEINMKKWLKARKKINFLEELGVRNKDKLLSAYFRLNLEEKNYFSAWTKWTEIEDDILREKLLRELMHFAINNNDYKFLQKKLPELKKVVKYWKTWEGELELIYAYVFLRLGQRKKAKQWLQWSMNHSFGKGNDKMLNVVHEEGLFLKSVVQLISFENKKAFLNLKKLLEDYPSSVRLSDYYFWYGVMLYEIEKRHLDAIMAIRQVNQEGERDDDRLYLLGKINHDQKKWRPAISSFLSLKKKYPNSRFIEESLFLQSDAYYKQKRYHSGLETINELETKYSPLKNTVRVIHLKVRILIALRKYEQADDVLRRRISSQADLSLIRLRVEVLKHIKDPKRILSVTGEGLGISTSEDEGFLYFHRANALYDMQKYQEADAYYNLAIKNPPRNTKRFIRFRVLKIQYVLGRIPELLKNLKKFLKVNNDDDYSNEILLLVGNYFLEKDEKEKAASYLNILLANYKESVRKVELAPEKRMEQIFLIGKIYNGLKKFEMAERWLNQALKSMDAIKEGRKEWQLSILREKGEVLFHLGKHRQALAASLKVLYLDHTMSPEQMYNLNLRIASSYVHLERPTEAQAIYRKMLKKIKTKQKRLKVEKLLRKLSEK